MSGDETNCIHAATYLQSTMSKCRLNNIHCHKDIADGIDVTNIAKSLYRKLLETKITLEDFV